MRRRRIHDSDDESPIPPTEPAKAGTAELSCPLVTKRSCTVAEGAVIVVISDSEDSRCGEGSSDSQTGPPLLTALEFAGKFGHFPGPDDSAMIVAVAEHPVPEVDDGFLWNAVPAKSCQYLDLEAVCADETSSGSSACGDSEGELTPGFVDDLEAEKENLSTDDALLLQRFFPHTAKYVDPMTLI